MLTPEEEAKVEAIVAGDASFEDTSSQPTSEAALGEPASKEVEVTEQVAEPETQEVVASDPTEDVKTKVETTAEPEGESESQHRVPYERFKQINDERKAYLDQLEQHKRLLMQAQAQQEAYAKVIQQIQQAPPPQTRVAERDPDLDWLYDDDDAPGQQQQPQQQQLPPEYRQLIERQKMVEQELARQQLTRELNAASDKFPRVPQSMLVDAVMRDGNADIMQVAQQIDSYVEEQVQAGIAAHLKAKTSSQEAASTDAPPRARKAGAPAGVKPTTDAGKDVESIEDAGEAALRWLQTQGSG